MAGEAGATPDFLNDLATAPYEFDFFQALRRLECAHADLPRTGHAVRADQEPVRFGQTPSLAFAPSTVAAFKAATNGSRPRLLVHFLGLLGPQGPMPTHVTDYIRDREINSDDPTLARFLDIFNHRVLSLFYRAWAGAQQAVSHQRPSEDRFAEYIASLIGLGMPTLRGRNAVPDLAKLHFSGRLASPTRPAEGLGAIIADFFGIPAAVEQFVGQWLPLEEPRRLRLGESRATGTLGVTAVVGGLVWDRSQKFRLRLGPMDFAAYQQFLPGGRGLAQLLAWVLTYIGYEFSFDVRLVLRSASIPATRLGSVGRLGWSTWLMTRPLGRDADDLVLSPRPSAA